MSFMSYVRCLCLSSPHFIPLWCGLFIGSYVIISPHFLPTFMNKWAMMRMSFFTPFHYFFFFFFVFFFFFITHVQSSPRFHLTFEVNLMFHHTYSPHLHSFLRIFPHSQFTSWHLYNHHLHSTTSFLLIAQLLMNSHRLHFKTSFSLS